MVAVLARKVHQRMEKTKGVTEYPSPVHPSRTVWCILLIISLSACLFPAPWSHMTSTLLYDVLKTVSLAVVKSNIRSNCTVGNSTGTGGSNSLGNLNYNPVEDPYYITNLESPILDWVSTALEGTEFTNIVHIVLESMRADSYPFDEQGNLMKHIQQNLQLVENGTDITTSNITPFIQSIAENTLSWNTMWATGAFTHKAMLGRISLFNNKTDERLLWTSPTSHRVHCGSKSASKILSTLSTRSLSLP